MYSVTVLLLGLFGIALSSDISTFKDKKCSASLDNHHGPNGYPNGTCTPLNVISTESFQITGLDDGCAVTLYGPDTTSDPCSADILIVGKLATCYNSTWQYYSIDGCDIPTVTPSATPVALPSSTSTSLASSSLTSSSATSSTTASASATPSPSAAPAEKTNHTPVIVGATLGGVGVVALISIAALLLVRHRRSKDPQSRYEPPSYELSNDRGLLEANNSYGEKIHNTELYAHDSIPLQEIGRNSVHIPPVELAGDALEGQDKKNINPIIKIHMDR